MYHDLFNKLKVVNNYYIYINKFKMTTGLTVKTSFFPLAWILYFVTPTININGKEFKREWGKNSFDLSPGDYQVKISFPYMGQSDMGANEISISLNEGEIKNISYEMPPWIFAKGDIKIDK